MTEMSEIRAIFQSDLKSDIPAFHDDIICKIINYGNIYN